jgi:LytS/YehU family sensor histidine kinase
LIDSDPARGKAMLLDLTSYLRTSLSRTLPEKMTLAQEMEIIRAYLNIQKVRMGDRLHFTIDVPDALREQPFPPMLLQPLVENAVQHGLEPKIDGGEIVIKAALESSALRVEVADTGMGLSSFDQSGVGIANVRERLRLLFADKGRFIIEENRPHGVKAVIEVPAHD